VVVKKKATKIIVPWNLTQEIAKPGFQNIIMIKEIKYAKNLFGVAVEGQYPLVQSKNVKHVRELIKPYHKKINLNEISN
jgi:hypothetical protein